jgi:GT2 family glycosyltransferase
MRTAFLLLSANEGHLLAQSLPAAVAEGFDDGLVIDNACTDDTAGVAAAHDVRRLVLPERVPYTHAMNAGLRELLGPLEPAGPRWPGAPDAVTLLTGDTFVSPGYRAACAAVLVGSAEVAVVAPKLIRTTGPLASEYLPELDAAGMSIDRRRKNGLVGHSAGVDAYAARATTFGADGAAAFWRAAAIRDCAIDGELFDPAFAGAGGAVWASDADLAWRAQLLGWSCVYEPAAVVHHIRRYSPSTRAESSAADRRNQFRNRLLMIAKNDSFADPLPLVLYEVAALGFALLRERELLGGYVEAAARLPSAVRARRTIRRRRRARSAPLGLQPPR